MTSSIKKIGSHAFAFATALLIERIIPALAVGFVAAGHELHHDSAQAEAQRRASARSEA